MKKVKVHIEDLLPDRTSCCEEILRALPAWFGIESSIVQYLRDIGEMETCVAAVAEEIMGFITINQSSPCSAEIQVMGVRPELHRRGIGRLLLEFAETRLIRHGVKLLQVKTLASSQPSAAYEKTRAFYEAMGFQPQEETTTVWGEESPCLIMAKELKARDE